MRISAAGLICVSTFLLALSGCRYLVDEDLSSCGGYQEIDCELRLQTNVQAELSTVLNLEGDINVSHALETWLGGFFSAYARDINLSFYDPEPDYPRLENMTENMNGQQAVYTFYLPAREYLSDAVANLKDNTQVFLEDGDYYGSAILRQHAVNDTIDSFNTGIFTARKEIRLEDYEDRKIDIRLYFANAASALVLEEAQGRSGGSIQVFATGFADSFRIADSCFVFSNKTVVRTERLSVEGGDRNCYAAVHFPSRDRPEEGGDDLWGWQVYNSLPDGTVTRSIVSVNEPLKAGSLKIVKAKVYENGVVSVTDPTVSVSFMLDWHEGGTHDVEL